MGAERREDLREKLSDALQEDDSESEYGMNLPLKRKRTRSPQKCHSITEAFKFGTTQKGSSTAESTVSDSVKNMPTPTTVAQTPSMADIDMSGTNSSANKTLNWANVITAHE